MGDVSGGKRATAFQGSCSNDQVGIFAGMSAFASPDRVNLALQRPFWE